MGRWVRENRWERWMRRRDRWVKENRQLCETGGSRDTENRWVMKKLSGHDKLMTMGVEGS